MKLILIIISASLHFIFGYNLNANNLRLLEGDGDGDSLFGWSMASYGDSLYVGSPLAPGGGKVWRCRNLQAQSSLPCERLTSPSGLTPGSWFGGSMAASNKLYTCAFRYKWEDYLVRQQVGKCFVLDSENTFQDLFDFTRRNFQKSTYSPWRYYGYYGISATVDDTGDLVIGNTIAFDNEGYWNNPYIVAGSFGKISNGVHQDAIHAAWLTSREDKNTMKNTFKLTGYEVTTGQFFKGQSRSFVITAPKADNYRGKVHICSDCFTQSSTRSFVFGDSAENLVVGGDQMGEQFGFSAVACDLTGDLTDDLIVGAPTYGDRFHYNSGRVHVFTREASGWPLQRLSLISPSLRLSGARFGSALGCLGGPSNQVVVGAPYYQLHGAVFVYRLKGRTLELSQTILSPGPSSTGFGLRLSGSVLPLQGIAVAAPPSSKSYFIRSRAVPRFRDQSQIEINPTSIDPNDPKSITLKIKLRISRISAPSVELIVRAIVQPDRRLTPVGNLIFQRTFIAGSETTSALVFTYNLDLIDGSVAPLDLRLTLQYSLPPCSDSYSNPCPVFDDKTEFNQITGADRKVVTKELEVPTINFNNCKNPSGCLCDVTAKSAIKSQIIAGQEETVKLGEIILSNIGPEPSPSTRLLLGLNSSDWSLQNPASCQRTETNISSCLLYVRELNATRFPLYISAIEIIGQEVEEISMTVSVWTDCQGSHSQILSEVLVIPVVHHWSIRPAQAPEQQAEEFYWAADDSDQEVPLSVSLEYEVTNTGPSTSSLAHIYVFLPRQPVLTNSEVTLDSLTCPLGDPQNLQRPPVVSSPGSSSVSCSVRGNCLVYHCTLVESLQRLERKTIKVSFQFEKAVAEERNEESSRLEVITSLCVLSTAQSEQETIICVDHPTHHTISTTSVFQYFRQSPLDLLIDYWQLVVGVGAAIIVCTLVLLLAWRFDLFQKVRFIKNPPAKRVARKGNSWP